MPQVNFSMRNVTLEQPNSFEPILRIVLECAYQRYGGHEPEHIEIFGTKGRLMVRKQGSSLMQVGIAEQEDRNSVHLGGTTHLTLVTKLSPYILSKLEQLRAGGDLWFNVQPLYGVSIGRNESKIIEPELLSIQSYGSDWKYPRSEWLDHLNSTEFDKTELIEIPKVRLPRLELSDEISKFYNDAKTAFNEGRYGDVLQECRKTLDVLDGGILEWSQTQTFTEEENKKIKENSSKEIYLAKLLGDKTKAERLNTVRSKFHYYLSLDPHQSEYKGMEFTIDDAKFVLHTTISFVNNVLRYLVAKQNKTLS